MSAQRPLSCPSPKAIAPLLLLLLELPLLLLLTVAGTDVLVLLLGTVPVLDDAAVDDELANGAGAPVNVLT